MLLNRFFLILRIILIFLLIRLCKGADDGGGRPEAISKALARALGRGKLL